MESIKTPNSSPPTIDERMNIVFIGHVDHGKSTIVGRLMADTGNLPLGKLEEVKESCLRNARPFEYAFLIDALKDERNQNITIDSARVFFKSTQRYYIIIDAPGHIEFIKNMVTGASRAEAAMLIIDASEGVQENSRRHGYLLKLLGICQFSIVINKMDLVDYRQSVYENLCSEYGAYLTEIGIQPKSFIPVSGQDGDNIVEISRHMPWYKGPTVLQTLDSFEKKRSLVDQPLRLPVQDIYRFTEFGDKRRIVAGTILSGCFSVGDEVIFYPSGKHGCVKSIEGFNIMPTRSAQAGQATGFTLEHQLYTKRGEIITRATDRPPQVARTLRVSLLWLGKEPLTTLKTYTLKLGTARVKTKVTKIISVIDTAWGDVIKDRQNVNRHEVADLEMSLNQELAYDPSDFLSDTSRFVIVDQYEICGGGIIQADVMDNERRLRDGVLQRNLHWVFSDLTSENRAARFSQRPTLVLITGKRSSRRKEIARDLEMHLFQEGRLVYLLGFGSVIYGVDADLKKGDSLNDHREHIRRLAEVAYVLLDAGFILILTAVELTNEDFRIISTVINGKQIETIWVGEEVTTDIKYSLRVTDCETAYKQIESFLLQQNSIVHI